MAETFGITKDSTSNYKIVMKYYENGNLYQYLDLSNGILSWINMIDMGIAREFMPKEKSIRIFTEEIYS